MNIAVLSFYYPPDIGAAANRISGFVEKWKEKDNINNIIVITTVPHYPSGRMRAPYHANKLYIEKKGRLTVYRVPTLLAGAKDSISKRLLGQIVFAVKALKLVPLLGVKPDVIIISSPPLAIALPGLILAYKFKVPLITEIRDLWPESLIEIKKIYKLHPVVIFASLFARFLYKKSRVLVGVTQGITKRLREYKSEVMWIPNGIDLKLLKNYKEEGILPHNKVFTIIYTGLIGYMQELERVVEAFRLLKNRKDIQLLIVGSGSKEKVIREIIRRYGLETQVKLLGEKPRAEVIRLIQKSHVGLVSLQNIRLFKDAFPSKVFDYILCKKPILSTVKGELAEFIKEYQIGVTVESQKAAEIIKVIELIKNNYSDYIKNIEKNLSILTRRFDSESLAEKYINSIKNWIEVK
ncbi:MAG: hypothetical protein DRP08_02120 [Candidatus Aenigmatarchaeota archaeon]|nr:MAG: hypothetical protein DRP08_02120 [Candidatus Aenigmarchaeota archaeon]